MQPARTYAMLIFKRQRMSVLLMAGTPAGSVGYASPSGWINNELFVKWLEHFIAFVKPTKDTKVILILDGHASHKTLEVVDMCRQSGVVLICLPPHTTHHMQPLDKTVYGPLKTNYNEECDRWMLQNPRQRITMYQQGALFGTAFVKTASMHKAVNGFRSTGLWPLNPEVFSDEDFMPSHVTDEPEPVSAANLLISEISDIPASATINSAEDAANLVDQGTDQNCAETATSHTGLLDQITNENCDDETAGLPTEGLAPSTSNCCIEVSMVSTAMDVIHQISPRPKSQKQRSRKRKAQSAAVLTSSPFKQQLMDSRPKPAAKRSAKLPSGDKLKRNATEKKGISSAPLVKPTKHGASRSSRQTTKKVTCRGQKEKAKKLPLPPAPKKRKSSVETTKEFCCVYCNELFVEPPDEDWLQCTSCKEWYHEQCGNDSEVCDLCSDSLQLRTFSSETVTWSRSDIFAVLQCNERLSC